MQTFTEKLRNKCVTEAALQVSVRSAFILQGTLSMPWFFGFQDTNFSDSGTSNSSDRHISFPRNGF